MKHFKVYLFFTFIILGFTQCKKEETTPSTPSTPSIIGKWEMVSETWKKYKNNVLIKSGTEDIKLLWCPCTMIFNKDGTGSTIDKFKTESFKYTLLNMNLVFDGNATKFTIVELTSDKLAFSFENDVTPTSKEVITDTFKKIK
jgi:hypothetical protein